MTSFVRGPQWYDQTATQLTLLLQGARSFEEDLGQDLYEIMKNMFMDWHDEKKADLYARLAERVERGMGYFNMRQAVVDCLTDNALEFNQ